MAGKMHRAARQQCAAYRFDAPRLGHRTVLALGPFIHGKHAVCIGGGGDDRHRAAHFCQPPGQGVGPAQMAGQQRYRKTAAFIQHHDGGVLRLAAAVRCNGPHGDTRRTHKNKGIGGGKLGGGPIGQRCAVFAAAGHSARAGGGQLVRQRQPFGGKGKIRAGHCGAPLRYSVVKAGS